MRRMWAIVLLANCASHAIGQTTAPQPSPTLLAEQEVDRPTGDLADGIRQLHDELQRQLAARDALTKEIQRLRELTGKTKQIVINLTVSELSLTKLRESNVIVDGVDTEVLKKCGIGGVLGTGVLNESEGARQIRRAEDGNFIMGTVTIDREDLLSELTTALKEAGAIKVLAQSTLATISGRPASYSSGGEFPIPVAQSNGKSIVVFKKFGTELDLVPEILGNGRVHLDVRTRVSEIDVDRTLVVGDLKMPALLVRSLDTVVEMDPGQTAVYAGLVRTRGPGTGPLASTPAKSASAPSGNDPVPAREPDTGPDKRPIEEFELVVTMRAEVVDVLKVAQ